MELLVGAAAVLVTAVVVLRELARDPQAAAPAAAHAPAAALQSRAEPAVSTERERKPELPSSPVAAPARTESTPAQTTPAQTPRADPVTASPPVTPAVQLPPVIAHAPVFARATTPGAVTVRVASPRPRAAVPPDRPRPSTQSTARETAPSTVLGVFRDTEPDGRTNGVRRATSALVLAAVTAAVATGVGGVIYLGLSRLG